MIVLHEADTVLYADSVEFAPEPCPGYSSVFVVGTYQLEAPDTRKGAILVFGTDSSSQPGRLCALDRIDDLPGVLDLKWKGPMLAAATADGSVQVFRACSAPSCSIRATQRIQLAHGIALSVDISCRSEAADLAASSHSDGAVAVSDITAGVVRRSIAKAHEFEAWTVAFDRNSDQILFSGGDDSCLCMWDLRSSCEKPASRNPRTFGGGVTTISAVPFDSDLLSVGSYDEHLRILDKRNLAKPLAVTEALGGGIWRAKWHPSGCRPCVACASMRGGFHVLGYEQGAARFQLLDHNPQGSPEAIAYGVDWCRPGLTAEEADMLVSASFYDHRIVYWRLG